LEAELATLRPQIDELQTAAASQKALNRTLEFKLQAAEVQAANAVAAFWAVKDEASNAADLLRSSLQAAQQEVRHTRGQKNKLAASS